MVCVHGFGTGSVFMDLVSFHAAHLHDELGVNVAAIVLPVHGARKPNRLSGEQFLGFDLMNSVHGITQAVWDVRRLLTWVRGQTADGVGVFGVSLGGLITALVAALETDLDMALAGVPMIDFPTLISHHAPLHLRLRSIEHHILDGTAQDVHRVVSPLAMPPVAPARCTGDLRGARRPSRDHGTGPSALGALGRARDVLVPRQPRRLPVVGQGLAVRRLDAGLERTGGMSGQEQAGSDLPGGGRPATFNLADLFELVAHEVPDAEAVVVGSRRLTYAELDDRAERLAGHLRSNGVGVDDFVGIQLTNGNEYLEAMLACFKLRVVPVNVNYRYVGAELRHLFVDAGLVAVVYDRSFGEQVGDALEAMADRRVLLEVGAGTDAPRVAGASDYEAALAGAPAVLPDVHRSGDDLYCVYTGGTTGLPKGVIWRHEDIFFAAMGGGDPTHSGQVIDEPAQLAQRVLRPGLVALATPPLMHASAHWLAFSTFFGGGTLVLMPGGHFDAAEAWSLVAAERANILVIVGDAMAGPLLDEVESWAQRDPTPDISSLMAIGSGDALLSPTMKERLAAALPSSMVVDAFGSSETGQLGGSQAADDPFGSPRLRVDDRTAVLDDEGRPVVAGSGVTGRLARRGRVPLRYHGDPARPRRRSSRWAAIGGRCRVTWRRSGPTARSWSSDASRSASTPAGRRSTRKRWRLR